MGILRNSTKCTFQSVLCFIHGVEIVTAFSALFLIVFFYIGNFTLVATIRGNDDLVSIHFITGFISNTLTNNL